MCTVSCFISQHDLKGVDVVGLYQTLKAIGYEVAVGNGFRVSTTVRMNESKEHTKQELIIDVECLLRRFKFSN
ncbi:MAG: hypothetical protein HPY60_11605 [Candidatus Methanofastidiosum sp.]|nr:hypothetical protein [Methanofastidiosum sp.]